MREFDVILALLFISTIVQPIAAIAQVVCGFALAAKSGSSSISSTRKIHSAQATAS